MWERFDTPFLAFKMEGSHKARNWAVSRSWKHRETFSPETSRKEHRVVTNLYSTENYLGLLACKTIG
jgi:hypothetical protein